MFELNTPIEKNYSSDQAQEMIDSLVSNDQESYLNLEYSKAFIERFKADTGFEMPWAERKYETLLKSYEDRQNEVKNSNVLKAQKWVDGRINSFKQWLGLGRSPEGLGILPAIPVAVGGALVGAGLLYAAYRIFRPKYSESTKDLQVSRELKAALATQSPETQDKILVDLEAQIDKAFNAGQNQGAIAQLLNLIKIGAIAGLAIWGFLKLYPLIDGQVKETQKKLSS